MSTLTGHVKIGGTYPLYISGNGTTNLAANEFDLIIAKLSGAAILNLPAVADCPEGYTLWIKNNSATAVDLTVNAASGDNILGSGGSSASSSTVSIAQLLILTVQHSVGAWHRIIGPLETT